MVVLNVAILRAMANSGIVGGWAPLKEELSEANTSNTFAMVDGFGINELGGLDGKHCHCCFGSHVGYVNRDALCLFLDYLEYTPFLLLD